MRNLHDGLSAVNIAESAIGDLSEILVNIEQLSVQSISGTYSDTQRQSMQQQVTAL
jgi:flagellin